MKLYIDDFSEGVKNMLALHKQGNNIFDMKGGSLFPHNSSQKTWQYAKEGDNMHFSDGTHTYSFKGQLADYDTELEKLPDVPLPDIFTNAQNKGKAQVHRSDPGSIYFTLQEGRNNPTYTLRHEGDNKWKAIPKPRKVKDQLKQPLTPHNVNLEHLKEGMMKELEDFQKNAEGVMDSINKGLGSAVQSVPNLATRAAMFPARMTGPVSFPGDNTKDLTEGLGAGVSNALTAGGVGLAGGGLYHLAKRHLLNTEEENKQEDEEGNSGVKRMLIPGLAMAGMNVAGRQMFPRAVNNPELNPFSS
jgi:hypothetical protein